MTTAAYTALGLLIVVINTLVTIAVLRSELYEPMQKRLQFLVIWLLPIVGAAFSWYVPREESRSSRKSGDGGNENFWWNYPDRNEGTHNDHGPDGSH